MVEEIHILWKNRVLTKDKEIIKKEVKKLTRLLLTLHLFKLIINIQIF